MLCPTCDISVHLPRAQQPRRHRSVKAAAPGHCTHSFAVTDVCTTADRRRTAQCAHPHLCGRLRWRNPKLGKALRCLCRDPPRRYAAISWFTAFVKCSVNATSDSRNGTKLDRLHSVPAARHKGSRLASMATALLPGPSHESQENRGRRVLSTENPSPSKMKR